MSLRSRESEKLPGFAIKSISFFLRRRRNALVESVGRIPNPATSVLENTVSFHRHALWISRRFNVGSLSETVEFPDKFGRCVSRSIEEATKVDSYPTAKRRVIHIKTGYVGNLDSHKKDRRNREKMDSTARELVVVWTTVAKSVDAEQLANGLVGARLAACVQVDSAMQSHYQWQGEIESTTEYRVVIKTRRSLLGKLKEWIKDHHPYEIPQFVAMEVLDVSESYRTWVLESTELEEEG